MRFCKICESYLIIVEDPDGLASYYCKKCDRYVKLQGDIILSIKKKSQYPTTNIERAMIYDNVTYKSVKIPCPDCDNDIIRTCLDESTMKNIYVCPKCKKSWKYN